MSLDDMVRRGELERLPPTVEEIPALLKTINRRIEDAANRTNHPETRLEQAYIAILNCALAALRHRGLYEGFTDVSQSQAEEAVTEASWLQNRLDAWLANRHPGLM